MKREGYVLGVSWQPSIVVSFKVVKPYHVGSVVAAAWKSEQAADLHAVFITGCRLLSTYACKGGSRIYQRGSC